MALGAVGVDVAVAHLLFQALDVEVDAGLALGGRLVAQEQHERHALVCRGVELDDLAEARLVVERLVERALVELAEAVVLAVLHGLDPLAGGPVLHGGELDELVHEGAGLGQQAVVEVLQLAGAGRDALAADDLVYGAVQKVGHRPGVLERDGLGVLVVAGHA